MKNIITLFIKTILPLIVLVAGILIAFQLMQTSPKAQKRPQQKNIAFVQTKPLTLTNQTPTLSIMGTVKASRSVELRPEVSGSVTSVSNAFIPGGFVKEGQTLLQIDQSSYTLALTQKESSVEQAKINLELENANQIVAQREFSMLKEQVSEEEKRLILRKPQLKNLQTALKIAEAQRDSAMLDLQKTTISVPFNSIVQSKNVTLGSWVSNSTTVTTLAGTDTFWIEASISEDQLKWVTFPTENQPGSQAIIYNPAGWGENVTRKGNVIQLLPGLEQTSRMATLLIEIQDPLAMEETNKHLPRLLIDSYVRVDIEGNQLKSALKLDRKYLHNGNQIWILTPNSTLEIRDIAITFADMDFVYITEGITPGERLITSQLTTPIAGMSLKDIATAPPKSMQPARGTPGSAPPGMTLSKRPTQKSRPVADTTDKGERP